MVRIQCLLLIVWIFVSKSHADAQAWDVNNYDFAPRDSVIFEDDFGDDNLGALPSKWRPVACVLTGDNIEMFDPGIYWVIRKGEAEHVLDIHTINTPIEPITRTAPYLSDSFTTEFDFAFDSLSFTCAELNFYATEKSDSCDMVRLHIPSSGDFVERNFRNSPPREELIGQAQYPGTFVQTAWHHFALNYNKKALDIYIDKYHVFSQPDCGFTPYALSLGCKPPVRFAHFKITTGKKINPFTKLLREKKFITHAINFDVGKATIRPESLSYLSGLASLLSQNPLMKIEIDGHTDSDGAAAANLGLSKARAEEVKKQLVSRGINASRLVAKGFGATRPIEPNTTAGGKAENRRVEFIRL